MKSLKIICFLLLFSWTSAVFSQHLIVNNALNYSKIRNDYHILTERFNNYYFGLERTFMENENRDYYLAMELGVLTKAGQQRNIMINGATTDIIEKFKYLTFNPSIRYKLKFPSSHIYLGVGPKIDILISKKDFESFIYQDLKAKSLIFGTTIEAGAIYDINDLRFGFQGQYNIDFSKLTNSELNIKAHSINFGVLLGYRFF